MTIRPHISSLTSLAVPEAPSVAPGGARVAYTLRSCDEDAAADRVVRSLWQVGAGGANPHRLTQGNDDRSPTWSPDGRHIAFLRADDGSAQLWVLPADGGEPEQLTTLPLGAGTPTWSPDSTRIAFSAPVDLVAVADESEESRTRRSAGPVVTDRLDYQADGSGLLRTLHMHVHVCDLATHKTRQVTDGRWHAGDPSWAPDGNRMAFTAAMTDDADLTFHSAAYVLDTAADQPQPQLVGAVDGFVSAASWTADGSGLLVVDNPQGPSGHARLFRVPLDGAARTDLTGSLDRNVMVGGPGYPGALPQLTADGRTVVFCVRDGGCTHAYAVDVHGGTPRCLVGGEGRNVSGVSVARDAAVIALVLGTAASYGEVMTVSVDGGSETVCTSHGESQSDVQPFERVARAFQISDGTTVHGWLVRDPDASGPQPLLLDIHGGPHNAWNGAADEFHLYHQELAAKGWAVLLLNPRGSDGYGEQFYSAVCGGWGEADRNDFLEPLDALVSEGVADPRRLAVSGYSYGGFMTCYLTSRDDRFAAAVAGGVVADLPSMAGTSDAGHFLAAHELHGYPWAESDRYETMSPYAEVDKVCTPTLILQGEADLRCPADQAKQWHTALRERGVPSRLVLYPGASHLFILEGKPSHRLDFNRRIVEWAEQYAGQVDGPRRAPLDAEHWQRRLETLAARHHVPGAALGILRLRPGGADELAEAAYGVVNTDTDVPVTADTLFQIGSMTKVWTATLVMQLVDEGRLDLDAPLVEVIPELCLADSEVTKQVTMRHLLTHTSGIDGDVFTDTGRGDDCLERYVAGLADAAQNHPLGATWSYCNSGFVLMGRIVEKLTGCTWDQAVRDRICTPLGLTHTVTLPEDALLYRAAVGHVGEEELSRAPAWQLPRALGPAGLVTCTAADALGFARLHLTGGVAPDGSRLLSQPSADVMQEKHADLPDKYSLGDSWGLGWIRFGWGGHQVVGHDGNTIGQAAFLRVLPEEGLAVTLLTNGGNTRDLYQDLYREIFAELADVPVPEPLAPPDEPPSVDITPHVGTYERASARIEVFVKEGEPTVRMTLTGPLAELDPEPVQELTMVPADSSGDLFCVREPSVQTWIPVTFYALPTGERYVHLGVRATPRVLTETAD